MRIAALSALCDTFRISYTAHSNFTVVGILADDMGLGKTLQVSSFVSGMIRKRRGKRAIVVAPKTLVAAWMKEFTICKMQDHIIEYGGSGKARGMSMKSIIKNGGILLTTYGMVQHNAKLLSGHPDYDDDDGPLWDVLVMDEVRAIEKICCICA